MRKKYIILVLLVAFIASLMGVAALYAGQEKKVKMKYNEEYLIELQTWKDREQAAQEKIKTLEARRDELRKQLADLDRQIQESDDAYWRELGTNAEGLRAYLDEITHLQDQIRVYLQMTSEELFEKKTEAEAIEPRFNELASRPASKHPNARALIAEMRGLFQQLKDALANAHPKPKPIVFNIYTVLKGDYLWKISKKPEIYNDPIKWTWIYTKNRDIIKNPNIIHIGQELKIFREVLENEYMVKKGDDLKKIAGLPEIYNDPFKWTALYELNKSVITNKNKLYPYMILYIK
jgi:hypothetical protein